MYQSNRVNAGDAAKDGCLERFPFGSIIATMLVIVGVILFCAMSYQAVNTSAEQVNGCKRKVETTPGNRHVSYLASRPTHSIKYK